MADDIKKDGPQILGNEGEGKEAAGADEGKEEGAGQEGAAGNEGGQGDKSGDKGSEGQSWLDGIDPEYRDDPSISKYKTPNELAKGHKNLVAKLGADKIVKPQEDWGEEQWNEFYKESGRPDSHDGYKLPEVQLPEGMTLTGEDTGVYTEAFHKAGLSQKQAGELYEGYLEIEKAKFEEAQAANKEAREAAENQLRKDWGKKYEVNVKLAEKTFMSVADEDAIEKFNKEGWGNDPAMIRLFAKLGEERSEDALGEGKPEDGVLTPDEAKKEIAAIQADKEHPYWVKNHPEHKFAVTRMEELHQMAYPEEASDIITE